MDADDPKDAKKEFNRVKDNASLDHRPKNVPDHDRAPPGASGIRPSLAPLGPGGTSQKVFKRHDVPEQGRDQKTHDADRSSDKGENPQKGGKHFEKRQLTRDFNERSR